MSVKPTSAIPWDSNLTNAIAVINIHKTDGWVSNEVPASSEVNTLWNNWSSWCSFANDVFNASGPALADIKIAAGSGATGTVTAVDYKHGNKTLELGAIGAVNNVTYDFSGVSISASNSGGVSGTIIIAIPLKIGDRIQSVTFNRKANATAYSQVCSVQKQSNGGTITIVQTAGAVATPTGNVWTQQLVTIGSPAAITTGEAWYAVWQPNAVIQSLASVDVIYDRP